MRTNEVVAIKKMSYSGKQSNEVRLVFNVYNNLVFKTAHKVSILNDKLSTLLFMTQC